MENHSIGELVNVSQAAWIQISVPQDLEASKALNSLRPKASELILRLGAYRLQAVLMENRSFSEGVLPRHCSSCKT